MKTGGVVMASLLGALALAVSCGGADPTLPPPPSSSSAPLPTTEVPDEATGFVNLTALTLPDEDGNATFAPPPEDECQKENNRLEALHQCGEQTNYTTNEDILNSYNIEELLLKYGGPPGKVVGADLKDVEELPKLKRRGEQNATDYFADFFGEKSAAVYNHSSSDLQRFVRVEEALLSDTGMQTGVRGELWWTPPELCGYMHTATYSLSSGGNDTLEVFVLKKHCQWERETNTVQCYGPHADPCMSLMSGPSGALLASLVG